MKLRLERLSERNFSDYEKLTSCESEGCYCAYWHAKWTSTDQWDQRKKSKPLENRELVRQKMLFGFHVGVLVYRESDLVAWISVGPLPEFYWTWKRVARYGEKAATVAGITCITVLPEHRSRKLQAEILTALQDYGVNAGWKMIEGYPFDENAYQAHGKSIAWPGNTEGFRAAGFQKMEAHWLSQPTYERSVYAVELPD